VTHTGKKKIAILGGGMGALTAAFELTNPSDWRDRVESVTVYQLGWRLGGKGASGRGPFKRIEEHGFHMWFGCYDNAFGIIRRCYDELARAPGEPLATWNEAFKPHDQVVLEEKVGSRYVHWPVTFPRNELQPGSDDNPFISIWDAVERILRHLFLQFSDSEHAHSPTAGTGGLLSLLGEVLGGADLRSLHLLHTHLDGAENEPEARSLNLGARMLYAGLKAVERASGAEDAFHKAIGWLLRGFRSWLWRHIGEFVEHHDATRRLWILMDLGLSTVIGIIADDVIGRGFDAIDDEDFRGWLGRHGADALTLGSAPVTGFYDSGFSYLKGLPGGATFAAGVSLRACLRMVLTYKGSLIYKMQAGMGETVFTPLYEVLRARGVRFEFFSRVRSVHPGEHDGRRVIERIKIGRQATVKAGEYAPLEASKRLLCWPSEPLYDQLVEGDTLRARGIDLESSWADWPDVGEAELVRGVDFTDVVMGISVGGLRDCSGPLLGDAAWREMLDNVKTVQTQSFQLWLKPDEAGLGWAQWRDAPPLLIGYTEPFDTWADVSHLIAREEWPSDAYPFNISYYCNALDEPSPVPPYTDHDYPRRARDQVKQNARSFLREHAHHFWPRFTLPGRPHDIDWELLIDPSGSVGEARFDAQYFRANIDPTERYVLAVPGATRYRLPSERSGYANMMLAGDWTRNGLNVGCIESAVMSGMQASRGLTGYPRKIVGEDF
jgi:uncharacterized protein with NAD-binding domain and iron-sulfur cluster